MNARSLLRALAWTAILVVMVTAPVLADKPGNGGSTGTGQVFLPNPVAALQDQTLTDQKDANYAALAPAYKIVTLTNLDGSGYLRGDWANIRSETGPAAYSASNDFLYYRDDDRFEQVMAYYWVTEAQNYIQSLGFGSTYPAINQESQDIRINQWGLDNSYSWDKHDVMRFGKGGVDDAEDAEVILHEYGHAMMDTQVRAPGLIYAGESGGVSEGFSDYWAVTVSDVVAPTLDPACVADWDSVAYTTKVPHCLRRVDLPLHYPEDLSGQVHSDGRLWSRALWDIRGALGHVKADTIILKANFDLAPDTTMPQAAQVVVDTAQALYGSVVAGTVRALFEARGMLP